MTDEQAIRAALAALADEAADPIRVRDRLTGRLRQGRQRRVLLRTAGVGAAALAVGGTTIGVRQLFAPAEAPSAPDLVVPGGPGGGWLELPLPYGPGWLPPRVGECARVVLFDEDGRRSTARLWRTPTSGGKLPRITLAYDDRIRDLEQDEREESHEVDGMPARLRHRDVRAEGVSLWWQPRGAVLPVALSVVLGEGLDATRTVALRIARSMRPTPGERLWVGPRFEWLPEGLADGFGLFQVELAELTWSQSMVRSTDEHTVEVATGPAAGLDLLAGTTEPWQVRGVVGQASAAAGAITCELGDGVRLRGRIEQAGAAGSLDTLVRVIDAMDLGPWPDTSWLGRR